MNGRQKAGVRGQESGARSQKSEVESPLPNAEVRCSLRLGSHLLSPDYWLLATGQRGFTLFELLASIGILAILSALLFAAFNQATKAWLQGENRVETFTQARAALDFMSRELSQAIVTPNVPFLGTNDGVAFIAPVSTDPNDGVDIEEVVYRLSDSAAFTQPDPSGFFVDVNPPRRLVRRVSAYKSTNPSIPSKCQYYYMSGVPPCPNAWDFYTDPYNWPETSDPTRTAIVADNIIRLRFTFVSTNGFEYSYWNSIQNPNQRAWIHEILNPSNPSLNGIGYNDPDMKIPPTPGSNGAQYMTNRAPALVTITIEVVDSRAAARLRTVTNNPTAWQNIVRESRRYFTTSVSIPNRQP